MLNMYVYKGRENLNIVILLVRLLKKNENIKIKF